MTEIEAELGVLELTGGEGGRWWVVSGAGNHLFDLDAGTVSWFPGRDLRPGHRALGTLIASIGVCTVGAPGEWALHEGPPEAPAGHWWIHTISIERIVRISDRSVPEG